MICRNISDESIKNLTRTCYTYSLPDKIELASNQHLTFIYGTAEKAKMCIPTVKAYKNCRLIVKDGYKHCEFLSKETAVYAKMITAKE